MGPLWYYSENDKPVGPLTLAELKAALAVREGPEQVLIWHDGLDGWQNAQSFPDLQPDTVAKSLPAKEVGPNRSSVKKVGSRLLTILTFALGLAIARNLSQPSLPSPNIQAAVTNDANVLSGKVREEFVKAGMASCVEKQQNSSENKELHLSTDDLTRYCSCYMNGLADSTSFSELKSISTNDPRIQNRMKSAGAACLGLKKRLMGGG